MCTAISINKNGFYFGRNLDWEHSFGEKIIATPREYPLKYRNGRIILSHYSVMGMGIECDGYPLYFDGFNEKGLAMAGLNFPEAVYFKIEEEKENIASFEFILRILAECESVSEARRVIKSINITDTAFSSKYPPSPLHWIISDENDCITVEQTEKGLEIYENPFRVLTNSPEFFYHKHRISEFINLSSYENKNRFIPEVDLYPYGRGFGGIGLPGDYSSSSRFVRAAFLRSSSIIGSEEKAVAEFFRILGSVAIPAGAVRSDCGVEATQYSSCCDISEKIYYCLYRGSLSVAEKNLNEDNSKGRKLTVYSS